MYPIQIPSAQINLVITQQALTTENYPQLPPLTPEEMEANQAIYDKVWDYVLSDVGCNDNDVEVEN